MSHHQTTTLVRLDSDLDPGIASRLLDLLGAQKRLPARLTIDWQPTRISFRLHFAATTSLPANLLIRLRQLPGVRALSLETSA